MPIPTELFVLVMRLLLDLAVTLADIMLIISARSAEAVLERPSAWPETIRGYVWCVWVKILTHKHVGGLMAKTWL